MTGALWRERVRGGALRPAPAARRVGGLDRRAQGRAQHALLAAHDARLRPVRASAGRAALRCRCSRCFALGLMAKPMLVTLPFVLLLLDWWPLGRWQPRQASQAARRAGRRLAPLDSARRREVAALPAGRGVERGDVRRAAPGRSRGGLETIPLAARAGNAALSYLHYLRQMLWPTGLSLYYPHPGTSVSVAGSIGALAILGLLFHPACGRPQSSPRRRRDLLVPGDAPAGDRSRSGRAAGASRSLHIRAAHRSVHRHHLGMRKARRRERASPRGGRSGRRCGHRGARRHGACAGGPVVG